MRESIPAPGPDDYQRADAFLREALTEAELLSVAGLREEIADLAAAAHLEPPTPTGPLAALLTGETPLEGIRRDTAQPSDPHHSSAAGSGVAGAADEPADASSRGGAPGDVVDLAESRRRLRRGFTAGFAIIALGAAGVAGTAAADSERPDPPGISLVVHVSPTAEPEPIEVPLVESSPSPTGANATGSGEDQPPVVEPPVAQPPVTGPPSDGSTAGSPASDTPSADEPSADRQERQERAERRAAQQARKAERLAERAAEQTERAAERQARKAAEDAWRDDASRRQGPSDRGPRDHEPQDRGAEDRGPKDRGPGSTVPKKNGK